MPSVAKARRQYRPPRRRGSHGSPPFTPSPDQQALVRALAGMAMKQTEISQVIINPHTDRPISPMTLRKFFRDELESGRAHLKSLIGRRYIEAVNAGQQWAIQAGLRQYYGWNANADGTPQAALDLDDDDALLAEFERLLAGIREARAIEAAASTPTIEGSAVEVLPPSESAPDEPIVPLPPQRDA